MWLRVMSLATLLLALLAPTAAADSGSAVSIQLASGLGNAGGGDPTVSLNGSGAYICSSQPGSWGTLSGAQWISPNIDCTAPEDARDYSYATSFTLPSGATNLSLSGSVLADDVVTVALNGVALPLTGAGGLASASTFSTSNQGLFHAGTNVLSFMVTNAGAQSGLDFIATVTGNGLDQGTAPHQVTYGNHPDRDHDDVDHPDGDHHDGSTHGQCVSQVAHSAPRGRGHGEAVRIAAHACNTDHDDD